jgi:hypothetical protein
VEELKRMLLKAQQENEQLRKKLSQRESTKIVEFRVQDDEEPKRQKKEPKVQNIWTKWEQNNNNNKAIDAKSQPIQAKKEETSVQSHGDISNEKEKAIR